METRVIVRPTPGAPMPWRVVLFVTVISVLVGAAMLLAAFLMSRQEAAYASEGVQTAGTVVDKRFAPGSGDSSDEYTLIYEFSTRDGSTYQGSGGASAQRYRQTGVGDSVSVTYLASRPGTNRIAGAMPAFVPYLIGAGGALILLFGVIVLWTTVVRRLRPGLPAATAIEPPGTRPDITYVFRRSPGRVLVDLLGAPFGAATFLGGAWFLGVNGAGDLDVLGRIAFLVGFGFFGLMLLTAIPGGLRRGLNPSVLEVGPGGMWIPEMGHLAWNEIRDVRLEAVRSAAGGTPQSGSTLEIGSLRFASRGAVRPDMQTTTYCRLGIVPVDPARERRVRRSLPTRLVSGFIGFVRMSGARSQDLPDLDAMAPFGVYDYEIGGSLDQAVAAVQRYRDITRPPVAATQAAPA